jgi:hypothetical protein
MPSTRNKLRVGRYKPGRSPKKPIERSSPKQRGRPPSAHKSESVTQKYIALAFQSHEYRQRKRAKGIKPPSIRVLVLRHIAVAHRRPTGKFVAPEIKSDDPNTVFAPTGKKHRWRLKDFETHPDFKSAYVQVCQILRDCVDERGQWRPRS